MNPVGYGDIPVGAINRYIEREKNTYLTLLHGQELIQNAYLICYVMLVASMFLNVVLFYTFCKGNLVSKYGIHFNILVIDVISTINFVNREFSTAVDIEILPTRNFVQYFLVCQRMLSVIALITLRKVIMTKFLPNKSVPQFNFSVHSINYFHTFAVWNLSFIFPTLLIYLGHYGTISRLITPDVILLPMLVICVSIFGSIFCTRIQFQNLDDDPLKESVSEYVTSVDVVVLYSLVILTFLPSFTLQCCFLSGYNLLDLAPYLHWFVIVSNILLCVNIISHPVIVFTTINDFKILSKKHFCNYKNSEMKINRIGA